MDEALPRAGESQRHQMRAKTDLRPHQSPLQQRLSPSISSKNPASRNYLIHNRFFPLAPAKTISYKAHVLQTGGTSALLPG